MLVEELIKKLQSLPQDARIKISACEDCNDQGDTYNDVNYVNYEAGAYAMADYKHIVVLWPQED